MSGLLAGDVILTRSVGVVGALIRFGERVRYAGWPAALAWLAKKATGTAAPDSIGDPWWPNHAAVFVGDGLIEALADGLTFSPPDKYPAQVITVPLARLIPDITDVERDRVVAFARTQLARHDRYGWASIASIILQLLTPLRLDISWDGALICSAFAAQCLEHAGVVLPTRSSLTTMPADLAALAATVPIRPAPPTARSEAA